VPAAPQPRHAPLGSGSPLPPDLQERLRRFIESLRQLDASGAAPLSPGASFAAAASAAAAAADSCGASTVSISPSDSASCCACRAPSLGAAAAAAAAAAGNGGEPWCYGGAAAGGGSGTDAQAAVERTLARHLRRLQLQHKSALGAVADARLGLTPPPRGGGGGGAGRLARAAPPYAGACDALLHCSPSSAASCSGPVRGRGAGAGAGGPDELRPTALAFEEDNGDCGGSDGGGADRAGRADAPRGGSGARAAPDAGRGAKVAAPRPGPGRRGVFVGNLPSAATERALMALFSRAGPISSCWIARNPNSQLSLGYGYVVYDSEADPLAHVRAARSLDGAPLERQPVKVRLSERDFDACPLAGSGSNFGSSGGGRRVRARSDGSAAAAALARKQRTPFVNARGALVQLPRVSAAAAAASHGLGANGLPAAAAAAVAAAQEQERRRRLR
jgi:hypothetical protein